MTADYTTAAGRLRARECDNCGWEGDAEEVVDVAWAEWVCPECGVDHDKAREYDEDPDYYRDLSLESA